MKNFTKQQAILALPEGEDVHVQMNPGENILIGADWKKEDIIKMIEEHETEVGGDICIGMGHGIVIWYEGRDKRPMFVEHKKGTDFTPYLHD